MAYKNRNIREFIDPAIQFRDTLIVNANKKKFLVVGSICVAITIIMLILFISSKSTILAIGMGVIVIIVLAIFISAYFKKNPLMIINENSIIINNENQYPWSEIDRIIYEEDLSNDGCDYFRFYLKDKRTFTFMIDGFQDQSETVIANHILKYFKNNL